MSSDMRLTEHFMLSEFTTSQTAARIGINNTPNEDIIERIQRVAEVMEKVRSVLLHPIIITSGYRCPPLNIAVGGSSTSFHMQGLACDFICPGFGDPLQICRTLSPFMKDWGIDQLIHEFQSWCHLGLCQEVDKPRQMALTIDKRGTLEGFV